jgi:hypothetical protein
LQRHDLLRPQRQRFRLQLVLRTYS